VGEWVWEEDGERTQRMVTKEKQRGKRVRSVGEREGEET
jgi:hypothetical protein